MNEFFNDLTNLSFPAGIMQDLITDKIEPGSQTNQTSSYCFVSRIDLTTALPIVHIIFRIEEKYYYHLDKIRVSYPKNRDGTSAPDLNIKIDQGDRGRNITPELLPVPMRLISTPDQEQVLRVAEKLNITFMPAGLISFTFTNLQDIGYLFIMTEGLRIPKKAQ